MKIRAKNQRIKMDLSKIGLQGILPLIILWLVLVGCSSNTIQISDSRLSDNSGPSSATLYAESPFISVEDAIIFSDNFDNGIATGWRLHPGCYVEKDGNNHALLLAEHTWAYPCASSWTDYALELRFKIIKGMFFINFRTRGDLRYGCLIEGGELNLKKFIGEDQFDLMRTKPGI